MYLIVGLGNPGIEYETTRHNVGFMVIDRLADVAGAKLDKADELARWGEATIAGQPALLAQPLTFMNNSGAAVRKFIREAHIGLAHMIVVCDDLDLEIGRIRVRPYGSSGGHKGIQSIISAL